ncbi:unnamed protein product [Prorocentrum cordatum]|uniref:Uncharacterized protein n=1 Tax=Prorocentrum cordatum TaxID=2364126 RepID=A0ABN9X3P6_9DINO|nr:unnamed protein product [Polarella glacialis]
MLTLGGAGVWWIYDVVRVGPRSSPIFASDDYRVSADVSHWAYVLTVITLMGVIGFGLSIWSINRHRVLKAREIMLLQAEVADPDNQPMYKSSGPVSFRGYGTTMQSGAPRV